MRSDDWGETWEEVDGLPHSINDLAFDPSDGDQMYVSSGQGVFRSDDQGLSWRRVSADLPTLASGAVTVDAAGTVFVGVPQTGVYRSGDDGVSWHATTAPAGYYSELQAAPDTPGLVLAARQTGEAYRISGGTTTQLSLGPAAMIAGFAFAPSSPSIVFAVGAFDGEGVIMRSTDRGLSWAPASSSIPGSTANAIAIDPHAPERVYLGHEAAGIFRSGDGGSSWSFLSTGVAVPLADVAVAPSDPRTVYAASGYEFGGGIIFVTRDGGSTWTASALPELSGFPSTMAVHPDDALTAYAGSWRGVYRTTNGGVTWEHVDCCSTLPWYGGVTDIVIRDGPVPTVLLATLSGAGVLASSDGGETWTVRSLGMITHQNEGTRFPLVQSLAADPYAPLGGLYAMTFDPSAHPNLARAYRSTPGSAAWTVARGFESVCQGCLPFYEVAVAGPDVVYAAKGSGYYGVCYEPAAEPGPTVLRSTDGGASWQTAGAGLGEQVVLDLIPGSAAGELFAGTCDDGVFVTSGNSWTHVADAPSGDPAGYARGADGTIYAATTEGLLTLRP